MALTLGQQPAESLWESAVSHFSNQSKNSIKIVFTCERHAFQGAKPYLKDPDIQIIPVTCVGMIHPNLLSRTLDGGAAEVQVVGCPPEDCANREGNLHLQERLDGVRKPVLRSAYSNAPITTDWLPPNQFKKALGTDTHQTQATSYQLTLTKNNWINFIPALALLAIVMGVQVFANSVPWHPDLTNSAEIEIILNHRSGYPLANLQTGLEPTIGENADTRMVLQVDEHILLDQVYASRGTERKSKIYERFQALPGEHHIVLTMYDREDENLPQILLDELMNLRVGQILVLKYEDTHIGKDPVAGEKLYREASLGTNASCKICHSLDPRENLVGPSFAGIATRAAERVPGMSAEEYLRQSIIDPDSYVVEGYPSGLMVPNFENTLTTAQIDDLVAFLMTLG